jgi:hypothetical protein
VALLIESLDVGVYLSMRPARRGSWQLGDVLPRKDGLGSFQVTRCGVMRFSSNYAPLFRRLLTPLVNRIRVAGPFRPAWHDAAIPELVLVDAAG